IGNCGRKNRGERLMPLTDQLRDDILASVPSLRAFAISLSGNGDRADDLVQETLLRALANIDSFQPGSNLPAWLFTILRNLFRSDYRKRRREVEDAEGNYAKTLKTQPSQGAHLEFEEFRAALEKLPQDHREAFILVGASGFSYEDAATICGCAVGTIKSRVNRARSKLAALLYVDGAEDFGPDDTVRAVIGGYGLDQRRKRPPPPLARRVALFFVYHYPHLTASRRTFPGLLPELVGSPPRDKS